MESKVKHMEFIQMTISRHASMSAQVKTWAIASLAAIVGLSRASKTQIVIAGIGVVFLFWLLDGFYLSRERRFRALYDKVRQLKTTDFSMDTRQFTEWRCNWLGACVSRVILLPYGAMLTGLIIFKYILR